MTKASPRSTQLTHDTAHMVRSAMNGGRPAFDALYRAYARYVHGILLASVDRDDVQDLVQNVFFRAWRELPRLREPAAFAGWIAMIARNEAKMHHRGARPTEELSERLSAPAANDATTTADVLRAIRALPDKYREPLMLRLVEEMGGEEIAERTGLSHGTVRVYLHHGMRLLREQLGAHDV